MQASRLALASPLTLAVGLAVAAVWAATPNSQNKLAESGLENLAKRTVDESRFPAVLNRGWALYVEGDYARAIAAYRHAAEMEFGALSPRLGLMNCHVARGDTEAALNAAQTVLALDESNYAARKRIAVILFERGNFSGAEAACRKIVAQYPEDLEAAALQGWCLLRQNNAAHARERFEEVLLSAPENLSAREGLTAAAIHEMKPISSP